VSGVQACHRLEQLELRMDELVFGELWIDSLTDSTDLLGAALVVRMSHPY
jgi:hypothetical protein